MLSSAGVWIVGSVLAGVVVYLLVAVLFAVTGWDVGRSSVHRPTDSAPPTDRARR